jgi:segregation and condensation protein B
MAGMPKDADSSSMPPASQQPTTDLPQSQLRIHTERDVAISPRMIVEAMLFVGGEDSLSEGTVGTRELTSSQLASHIRDVSSAEVDEIVKHLNQLYRKESCPYEIVTVAGGYRIQLCEEFARTRDRFRSPGRAIKLTPMAMEVLSVVAYQQPVTAEQIQKLRGIRSQTVLNQLVHRQLLKLERRTDAPNKPWYRTTERFIRLFQLQSLDDLPRSEDLDDT